MFQKSVLQSFISALLMAALVLLCPIRAKAQNNTDNKNTQNLSLDADQLGMALEYFQAAKYHEALLIFQKLDKRYKLNPRFRAYIGLCYYYEWDYKKAVGYFDKVLPELKGLSPHELSVYYYAAGESYFQLQQYAKALPYFNLDLKVCYDKEKGDVYYRIGFCYMFQKEWHKAFDNYTMAEKYYNSFRDTSELKGRLAQISNMKKGCLPGIAKEIDAERSELLKSSSQRPVPFSSPWEKIILKNPPIIWK